MSASRPLAQGAVVRVLKSEISGAKILGGLRGQSACLLHVHMSLSTSSAYSMC